MMETERQGHAHEAVQSLSLAELQSYDGIVAVCGVLSPNAAELVVVAPARILIADIWEGNGVR